MQLSLLPLSVLRVLGLGIGRDGRTVPRRVCWSLRGALAVALAVRAGGTLLLRGRSMHAMLLLVASGGTVRALVLLVQRCGCLRGAVWHLGPASDADAEASSAHVHLGRALAGLRQRSQHAHGAARAARHEAQRLAGRPVPAAVCLLLLLLLLLVGGRV